MPGLMPKDLKQSMPALDDQGIKNVVGSPARGVSLQAVTVTMASSPETFTFAALGLEDMANTSYQVIPINQTDSTDPASCTTKAVDSFEITGPDAADVVDVLIIGKVKGQLG